MIITRIGFMGCPEINVPDGRLFPRLVSANDHAMVGEFLSERQRSAGPWPTGVDWRDIVDGDWKAGEWSVKN